MYALILIFCSFLQSQEDLPKQTRSAYEGNHFVVGFMQNEIYGYVNQTLLLSSRYNTSVTITFPDEIKEYIVSPNNSKKVNVSMDYMVYKEGLVTNKNIDIKSDKFISVVGYSSQKTSSDMFTAIPTSKWGTEYQAITMGNDFYHDVITSPFYEERTAPRTGEFLILANDDNTTITFTPRARTRTFDGNKEEIITLNKWESYLVQGYEAKTKNAYDLSGSIIRSDKPIGLISGHMRSAVTPNLTDNFGDSKDHLIEMLNPSNLFGKEYVTAPFGQSIKSYYCLTTIKSNTVVDVVHNGGTEKIQLDFPGAKKYIRIDGAAKWTSNNEFQLGQFMARFGDDDEICNDFYDPAFVIIQPMEYFNNNLNFLTVDYNESNYGHSQTATLCGEKIKNVQYVSHHLLLISKDEARFNTLIDGMPFQVTEYEGTIPGTDYYYGYAELLPGDHIVETDDGGFQAIMYGRGYQDSYAYSLGGAGVPEGSLDIYAPDISAIDDCNTVIFQINDNRIDDSGIQFVEIAEYLTNNVDIEEFNIENEDAVIKVTRKDKRKDAKVTIDYYDNAGNGKRYSHTFSGVDPIVKDLNLGTIEIDPDFVYSTMITNNGNEEIEIRNIVFNDDNFYLQFPFSPFKLQANEERLINFLIKDDNIGSIPKLVKLFAVSDCDVIDTAEIKLSSVSYGITALGYDFEEVLLGDRECGVVYWENTDSLDLTITELEFDNSTPINLDTNGKFPITLKVGERLDIISCIQPFDRQHNPLNVTAKVIAFYGEGEFSKTISFDKSVQINYLVVGAIFEDKELDFGEVFLNKSSDEVLNIQNTGNHVGTPVLKSLDIIANDTLSIKNQDMIVNIESEFTMGEDKDFIFSFEPKNIGYYENVYTFEYEEGVIPKEFTITLKGNANGSVISNIDYCFDTLWVGESESRIVDYLEYQGNIDRTVYFVNKKNAYFTDPVTNVRSIIPYTISGLKVPNLNYPSTISNGDTLRTELVFEPLQEGLYELEILTITNSLSTEKLFDSTISVICGYAKMPILPELDIVITNDEVWACDTAIGNIRVTNIGKTDVSVKELELLSTYYTKITSTYSLPFDLKINDYVDFPIELFRLKDEVDEIEIKITATDDLDRHSTTFSAKKLIEPKFTQLILPDLEFKYNIKDTSVVNIYGDIPYDIDIPAKLKIKITADYKIMWLLSKNAELIITDDKGNEERIPIKVNKNLNDIEFDLAFFEFEVLPNQRWSLDLNFMFMMTSYLESDLIIDVSYDDCFQSITKSYPVILEDVCFQFGRIIDYFDQGKINTRYNYDKNELIVNLDIPVSSNYSIYLIDMLGKKHILEEKKFANIGKYFLNYDLKNFPNGNYFLNVDTKYLKEQKQIIIIK